MLRWIPYTFIRTFFFFAAGILTGIFFPVIFSESACYRIVFFLGVLYVFFFFLNRKFPGWQFNNGYIALPVVFLGGYLHVLDKTEIRHPGHINSLAEKIGHYCVTVSGYAEEKENSWKVTATAFLAEAENEWRPVSGKVLIYFSKKDFPRPFNYGDRLLIRRFPQLVPPPGNPGEFDHATFLRYKNIYHQQFVKGGQVISLGHKPESYIRYYALTCRLWANDVIGKFVRDDQARGIASALILGVTDGLDNDLLGAYAATGAMHVLAVSGLHVSIIYLIIVFILKPLTATKRGNLMIAVISIFLLWGYAYVTGLSPSVLRAVTMFTFIAVARAASRDTNIFNTLAASAFCLLLYDPFLIMSVGFQLSYLAVGGIVYLEPLLREVWTPRLWMVNEVWKITRVSLAAQLATLPLTLFYFHQFPNYFLLTNLLVVPLSFLILIIGLLLLAVGFLPVIASVVGTVLELSVRLLNLTVTGIEWLPYSHVENIHITAFQCWVLMVVIVFLVVATELKKFSYIRVSFLFVIIFSAAQWFDHLAKPIRKLTIYKVPGATAMDLFERANVFFIGDTLKGSRISFHIRPNRILSGAGDAGKDGNLFTREMHSSKLIRWNNRNILMIGDKDFKLRSSQDISLVIVSNESVNDPAAISQLYPNALIVIDSSNSYYYANNLLRQCKASQIRCYSVLHQGALTI